MLKGPLLHPEILAALAAAGHGSKVLIADGNYPHATTAGPNASVVFLNLAPGTVTVTEALDAILTAVPVEAAHVIQPPPGMDPPILREFRTRLGDLPLQPLERHAFYEAVRSPDTCLVVATGEQRIYACLLLTIGVAMPPASSQRDPERAPGRA
ncbi:MAG: RbsD/FucU family protein [Fimbriimonadaceae bacterium]